MTANKMPEMPPAFAFHNNLAANPLYTADQMRAMYLAGIEAAKACVPRSKAAFRGPGSVEGWNSCRATTLANLDALTKETP